MTAVPRKKMIKFVEALGFDPKKVFEVTLTPERATVTAFRDFEQRGKGGFDILDIPWSDPTPKPKRPKKLKVGDVVEAKDIQFWKKKLGVNRDYIAKNRFGGTIHVHNWLENFAPYTVTKVPEPAPKEFKVGDMVDGKTMNDLLPDGATVWFDYGHDYYWVKRNGTWFQDDGVQKWTPWKSDSKREIRSLPSKFSVGQVVKGAAAYEELPVGTEVWYNGINIYNRYWTKKSNSFWQSSDPSTWSSETSAGLGYANDGRKIKKLP